MYKDIKTEGPEGGAAQMSESLQYWKTTSGHSYRELIRIREAQGNSAYAQQERALTSLIQTEQKRLGRPLNVLEFGCGFGRHAAYIASIPHVRYHGYDISEPMTAPLRAEPPPTVTPVEERIFCGDDPLETLGGRQFDLVFTVSTLIHNPTERIPGLLATLGQLVVPSGLLVLVENLLVPTSVWDNSWHQGCWLHSYPEALPEGWDLHHGPEVVESHDVYVLKRNEGQGRRYFHLLGPQTPRDESQPLTLDALHLRGLPRFKVWAGQASQALGQAAVSGDGRVAELTERLAAETERFDRRQRLMGLSDDLARLRAQRVPAPDAPLPPPAPSGVNPGVMFDVPQDTRWANDAPRFGRLLHVFHQEWHGIRAAAGYLPGHKMAIAAERPLHMRELKSAVEHVERSLCSAVIVHGYSPNAHELIVSLRKVLGSSVRIFAVWHGSTAQFHYAFELDCFSQLVELRRKGDIDGLATVKPGMHLLSEDIFPKTLLNLPPRVSKEERANVANITRTALIPTPNDWRKNFFTNLFACQASSRLDDVYVTANFKLPPVFKGTKRIHHVLRPSRTELFDLVRDSDVVLNASLSECQPMTGLEALSLGVPCISGPLSLGALDAHPYQRLAQVQGVDSVNVVQEALERMVALRETSPGEIEQMMEDYALALKAAAVQVLEEFIQS
ncbi:methyltransferase [Comamonas sp. JC664]|uniref:methyltransferase n=1 Tax=Comamonas sp. JC664 TaxID=2801917 RepID=UPI00188AF30C|nr:methyltransferase [Comamonas sp. JC664]GHG85268.1 hypothetical protein GCM10012319_41730 [Comamonas sp. KCTC 72670]